jgi:hypothetical protein
LLYQVFGDSIPAASFQIKVDLRRQSVHHEIVNVVNLRACGSTGVLAEITGEIEVGNTAT